jgi:rhamnosyltransferase
MEERPLAPEVCAVIVAFRPVEEHFQNALKARAQVGKLVVVDNGSSPQALAPFREARQAGLFHLIENGENLGVAAALNTGIRWAKAQGCDWVVLFDQDSTVTDGMIEALLAAYRADPDRERVGTVVPTYIDRFSGNEMPVERHKSGRILTVSTSSSLIPQSIFERCGDFREDFVIDQIDYEFCLRIVAAGYKIVQCRDARLLHSLGERREYGVGGKHLLTSTHHNARRRYYIMRNRVVLLRLYWRSFPRYCLNLFSLSWKDTVKILLVESDKGAKLKNTLKGVVDGVLGRMGKRVEL